MYKLSPSKAHRFLVCTKSLEHDVEFTETAVTIRGKMLHDLAEKKLREEDIFDFVKNNDINEYEHFLIDGYVKTVINEYYQLGAHTLQVEIKEPIFIYGNTINIVIDALVLAKVKASILDLKTGNTDVEITDNEQMMFYAYLVATKYPKINTIYISIYQKGRQKKHKILRSEVFDFFISKEHIFEKIRKNELEYNPSDSACKYCAIKKTCMARAKWIIEGKKE